MSVEKKNLKAHLNFLNSTTTFRKLINKYYMKKKEPSKHNKKLLLKKIEAKIQELENEEKENDFIINEVRRNAQINKEILYSFGTKALNHIDEIKKVNVASKLDKNKFFEPDKEENNYWVTEFNEQRNKSQNYRYNQNKIITLPKIILKSRNKNSYDSNISLNKKFDYLSDSKNESLSKKCKNNSSFDSKEKNKDISDSISAINKKGPSYNLTVFNSKSPLMTEIEIKDTNLNTFKKKPIIIDHDYINYIQEIKTKFLKAEKKQERYFGAHKYGYDAFKLKYNYLKKKYFD